MFLTARLTGTTRADLDLYVYKHGAQRPLAFSAKRGSNELVQQVLPPGRYEVLYWAYRRAGVARLSVVPE